MFQSQADDVVFILKPEDDPEILKRHIDNFLETRGLKVKEAKTKVVYSTNGFDFLGWNFCIKPNGKFISTPSQRATSGIKVKVKEVMKDSRFTLEERIKKCGSVIRGWRNYHRFCDMSQHDLWSLCHWLWKFIRKQGRYNRNQTNKVIKRAIPSVSWSACKFVSVKGNKSHYDGDFVYWSKRENANYDGITARLLKKQNHKCTGGVVFLTLGGALAQQNWHYPFGIYLFAWPIALLVFAFISEPDRSNSAQPNMRSANDLTSQTTPVGVMIIVY